MSHPECTSFLQWALPLLGFRWPGFRKVRRQVCRRIRRRIAELGLESFESYRLRVDRDPDELQVLDGFCRITISRFFRDRRVFDHLADDLLPALAEATRTRRDPAIRVWSAGCGSGEEPYSLAIAWRLAVAARFPDVELRIVATDADPHLLERARFGAYEAGSLQELPAGWREKAFHHRDGLFHLQDDFRRGIAFRHQDLRDEMPAGPFDLVLCRNLAFTYFDEPLQRWIQRRIATRLRPGGWLTIDGHESLPAAVSTLEPAGRCFYRRTMIRSELNRERSPPCR